MPTDPTDHEDFTSDLLDSEANPGADMGRQPTPDEDRVPDESAPEQRPGNPEEPVEGLPPKAGYPSKNPKSKDHPYDPDSVARPSDLPEQRRE